VGHINLNWGLIKFFKDDPDAVNLVGLNTTELWVLYDFLKNSPADIAKLNDKETVGLFVVVDVERYGEKYTIGFIRHTPGSEAFMNDPYAQIFHVKKHTETTDE